MILPPSNPLHPYVVQLHKQADAVGKAHAEYLKLEAEKKHFEATLIMATKGDSQKERETNAQAAPEWLEFHKTLARAKAVYEFQRLKFSVIEKEYFAQHQQIALDEGLINKGE